MEFVKFFFAVGQMFAFVGFGYSVLLTFYFVLSKTTKMTAKEYQRSFFNGIHACLSGIVIMALSLAYGLFGVLK